MIALGTRSLHGITYFPYAEYGCFTIQRKSIKWLKDFQNLRSNILIPGWLVVQMHDVRCERRRERSQRNKKTDDIETKIHLSVKCFTIQCTFYIDCNLLNCCIQNPLNRMCMYHILNHMYHVCVTLYTCVCTVLCSFGGFFAFDFCRSRLVIRIFHPRRCQRPMTSDFEGFSISDVIHYICFAILILQKVPVFPF